MTPQESSMLQDLIQKVEETKLTEKDPEAEQMLQQGLSRDPDAIYKLAQTVLVQNLALNQARAQIDQMKQAQLQAPPARATSFLGGLLGHRDPAPPPAQPPYQQVPYQQAPPQYSSAPIYVESAPSPAGSFLRSAATTAAGVAAGALAFEGIESLMHGGFGGGGGWGGGGFGGGGFGYGAPPVEETVINNYYDDPQRGGGEEHRGQEASFDDRREDHAGLHDASYQTDRDSSSRDDSASGDGGGDGDGGDGDSSGGDSGGDGDSNDFV